MPQVSPSVKFSINMAEMTAGFKKIADAMKMSAILAPWALVAPDDIPSWWELI